MSVTYELIAQCPHTGARRGRLHTRRGTVELPAFMPVGTAGSVKTTAWSDIRSWGFELVLANTYHLALRPGEDLVHQMGGLAEFTGWRGPMLTDSGGYQVMSLSKQRKIDDDGVTFKSHLDGSAMRLTPERSIEIQSRLGVDIAMALDECPPYPCPPEEARKAMDRTHAWASRNLDARTENLAVFGIVQGGVNLDWRTASAAFISGLPFDGYAIGGVSVGEPTEMQFPVVQHTAPLLPKDKARYLMGVGHPGDIIHAVACGVDLFDCVLPTRMARHNALYTLRGRVNAANAEWATHNGPHDPDSDFLPDTSAAYLRHLFKANEPSAARLATAHNLQFYARMMAEIREAIERGTWPQLAERYARA